MKIKSTAISSFAKFILGGTTFTRLIGIAKRQQDSNLSGAEKREAALADIEMIGLDIGGWAINLGIELAVAWLKSQAGEI